MRTVIIGAVALGASCAARLKRLEPEHEVILLEKGSYASFANCGLPYFVGDEIKSKDNLLVVNESVFKNRFKIDLRTNSEVTSIDSENKLVTVMNHLTKESYTLNYDNLVLAMGADAIKPPLKGIDDKDIYTLKNVDDAVALKDKMSEAKDVVVIGGGFIGLEAMENLVYAGKNVHLIEGRNSVSTLDYDMAQIVHKIIKANDVDLRLGTMVEGFSRLNDQELVVHTSKGDIKTNAVVLAIGVRPNTKLALEAGIELDENKTIKVDEYLRTNKEGIYAGGDLVSNYEAVTDHLVYVALANYANKHGRIIANNIVFGPSYQRQKISMASVFKLFDFTIASVGLGEALLNKFSIKTLSLYQAANSHATYYPGATPIYAKIRYDHEGKIYGAQMIGKNLVEKRIDVISSILLHKGNYKDLMEVESCYAPPYGSAKDINNFFGFMIDNALHLGIKSIDPMEVKHLEDQLFVVDVRGKALYDQGHIKNAINIPLDSLRDHLDLLPKDKTIYINCMVGITSYNALCILRDLGYDVVNISGGYTLYALMN